MPIGKKSPIFEILLHTISMFNSVMLMAKTLHRRANIQENLSFKLFRKSDVSAFAGVGQKLPEHFLLKRVMILSKFMDPYSIEKDRKVIIFL